MDNKDHKKPIYKKWWFWAAIVLVIIIIASLGGGNDTNNTNTTSSTTGATDKLQATSNNNTTNKIIAQTENNPTTSASVAKISVTKQLKNGNFTAGIDFPAGVYDITAISGGGNVSSSNMYNGGINAVMGTKEENAKLGSDIYEEKYQNIDLPDGVILNISGVTVEISTNAADGSPLKKRTQTITETIELGNGNFVAGKDFPAGTYDITAISGGGNVSSDNIFSGGINAVMGVAEKNTEIGSNLYHQEYFNIDLPKDTTLTISGVKVKLTPSK